MYPPSRMLAHVRWTALGVCALWLVACEPGPTADAEATGGTTAQAQLQSTDACLQRDLGAPAENRQVTLDQSQTVRFSEGTVVHVPLNAFVFEDGSAPEGPVELRVKECYTLADFLTQGLHTQSGESLLESGGTIHVSAFSNGQELHLRDGVELGLNFASAAASYANMQIFYGVEAPDGSMDWIPAEGNPRPGRVNQTQAYRSPGVRMVPDLMNLDSTLLTPELYDSRLHVGRYMSQYEDYSTHWALLGTTLTFNQEFDRLAAEVDLGNATACQSITDLRGGVCGVDCEITFNAEGAISEVHFESNGLPLYELAVREVLKQMPRLDMRRMPDIKARKTYEFGFTTWKILNEEMYREAFAAKHGINRYETLTTASVSDVKRYMLRTGRLGWINCDRFYSIPEEQKTDLIVTSAQPDARLMLAFKDFNGVMAPQQVNNRAVFGNVPENERGTLYGIRYGENGPEVASMEFNIDGEPVALDSFKPVTLAELDEMMGVRM